MADQIEAGGGSAVAHQADVSDEDEVEAMFERCGKEFGPPDILVANAGMPKDAELISMSTANGDTVLSTILRGYFLCARAAASEFGRRNGKKRLKIGRIHSVRVPLMGVRRAHQGRPLGAALMMAMFDRIRATAYARGVREAELSWALEDNRPDAANRGAHGRARLQALPALRKGPLI